MTGSTPRLRRRPAEGRSSPGQVSGPLRAAAVATTGAFAGGALLTQTVIVPTWRAMDPAAFLVHFRRYGPATGATLFPLELAATGLLARATSSAARDDQPGRRELALAAGCMIGTLLLLPLHFARANRALLQPDFPLEDVAGELRAWSTWNWARTGLAIAASGLSCAAAAARARRTGPRGARR